jgi:FkbM family methyltransferase
MFKRRVQEALGLSRRFERTAAPPGVRPDEALAQSASQSSPADPPSALASHTDILVLREMHSLTRRILRHQAAASARRERDLRKRLAALESLVDRQLLSLAAAHAKLLERIEGRLSELASIQARTEERLEHRLSQWEVQWHNIEGRLSELASMQARTEERLEHRLVQWEAGQAQWHKCLDGLSQELQDLRSAVRPPVVVSPSGVIAVEVNGFLLGVPAEEWRLASGLAIWGTLERGLTRCFERLVKPGMTVVDIGASIGIYTLHAARLAGPSGTVFSFEPSPRVFPALQQNVITNGFAERHSVHCVQVAVTDRRGEWDLFFQLGLSGHSTLFPKRVAGELQAPVSTAPLDDLITPGTKVDVVKIDAEGSEPLILRGMRRVIQENPGVVLLMEFAPSHLLRAGVDPATFLAELDKNGFQLQRVEPYNGEVQSVSWDFLADCYSENLCLRRAQA